MPGGGARGQNLVHFEYWYSYSLFPCSYIPFSDTECVFLDIALLVEILKKVSVFSNDYLGKHCALLTNHLVIL